MNSSDINFITVITDCKDDNAKTRQTTRISTLFPGININFIGVDSDLEASGNLIDCLDASGGQKGVVLVNVAPRHREAKKWENGTPFGFFFYKETLVVISIDGLTLSLVKKLNLVDHINLMDIPEVLESLRDDKVIDQYLYLHIKNTQFRSFEFLPRVAKWITEKKLIPATIYPLTEVKDSPLAIWWIDNFGNCKTTLLEKDIEIKNNKVKLLNNEFTFYERLKNVPDDLKAVIIGSSGLDDQRFLEIVVQGKSAKEILNLKSGNLI